jgi:hypothetical protein
MEKKCVFCDEKMIILFKKVYADRHFRKGFILGNLALK